jgi:hypothetical protein
VQIAGNAVDEAIGGVHPDWQARLDEPVIPGRRAEVEHLLPRRLHARADRIRKESAEPRATGEHESIRLEPAAVAQAHIGTRTIPAN